MRFSLSIITCNTSNAHCLKFLSNNRLNFYSLIRKFVSNWKRALFETAYQTSLIQTAVTSIALFIKQRTHWLDRNVKSITHTCLWRLTFRYINATFRCSCLQALFRNNEKLKKTEKKWNIKKSETSFFCANPSRKFTRFLCQHRTTRKPTRFVRRVGNITFQIQGQTKRPRETCYAIDYMPSPQFEEK